MTGRRAMLPCALLLGLAVTRLAAAPYVVNGDFEQEPTDGNPVPGWSLVYDPTRVGCFSAIARASGSVSAP